MTVLDDIPKSYEEAIDLLARWHGEEQIYSLEIYAVPDPDKNQVRLIEVSDDFPQPGPVIAMPLGRSSTFPFKSAVALATRHEWQELQRGDRAAPEGWDLRSARKVWPRD